MYCVEWSSQRDHRSSEWDFVLALIMCECVSVCGLSKLFLELAPNGQNRNWVSRKHAHTKRLPEIVLGPLKTQQKVTLAKDSKNPKQTSLWIRERNVFCYVLCFVLFCLFCSRRSPTIIICYCCCIENEVQIEFKFRNIPNSLRKQITYIRDQMNFMEESRQTSTARQAFDHFFSSCGRHICAHAKP